MLVDIDRDGYEDSQEALMMRFNDHIWAFPMTMQMQFFMHEYENLERAVVHRMYSEGDVVLEAGGGSGVVGLTIVYTGAKLITYEPREQHCLLMNDMFHLNKFDDVKIVAAAIASETGYVTLTTDKIWWDATIIAQDHLTRPTDQREVPCFNVNDMLKKHGANALHLDVEGGELNILSVLDLGLINKFSLEVHPSMIGEGSYDGIIVPRLTDAGFEMVVEAGMDRNYPTHDLVVGWEKK